MIKMHYYLPWNEQETKWVKEFTTTQKNLDRSITMQNLRFEFSDSSDCSTEKDRFDSNMIHCNVILCLTQQKKKKIFLTFYYNHVRFLIRDFLSDQLNSLNFSYFIWIQFHTHIVDNSDLHWNHKTACCYIWHV